MTNDKKQKDLHLQVEAREREVYGYQMNIDNYESLLNLLPKAWPNELFQYQGLTSEQIVNQVPDADMQLVADCIFRDKIAVTLKIEKLEQRKAILILNAIKAQLEQ